MRLQMPSTMVLIGIQTQKVTFNQQTKLPK